MAVTVEGQVTLTGKRWTKAMRAKAAEDGRRGGLKGGKAGGLIAWHTRTEEQKAEILARLAAGRPLGRAKGLKRPQTSPKARAAQRARALDKNGHPRVHSQAQAERLREMGILKTSDKPPIEPQIPAGWPKGQPHPSQYPSHTDWKWAMRAWDRERAEKERV